MHQLPLTSLLNHWFAGPVTALLMALGVHPEHPTAPIPDHIAMQLLVFVILMVFFVAVRANLSVEHPGTLQHIMESVYNMMDAQSEEIIGPSSRRYLSYLITLGLFILISNMLGLIPFLESPTAVPVVPLGCAVVTWFYYQTQGFRTNGAGYIKHFIGPIQGWAPQVLLLELLMFLIETCSHLARMLSLTVRLFANMFAGDMVTLVFFSLIPIGVPVIFMILHFGVSLIQTLIFVLLPMVYIGEAVAHEH